MNKITLGLLLVLVSSNALAKKIASNTLVPPRTWQLTCPPNPAVSIQCGSTSPVNCYLWAGTLVPSAWASTPLVSNGMPAGFMMPAPTAPNQKAEFKLVGGNPKQGTAFMAQCFYEYTYNGTVKFNAVQAFTPPEGTTTCQFVASKRGFTCQ